jgi:hypothetical protein
LRVRAVAGYFFNHFQVIFVLKTLKRVFYHERGSEGGTDATGYRKLLVTFMDIPKVAIMKENSPICAKLIPVCMDCFKGPEIKAPIVELMDCPKMVIKVKISTGNIFI